MLQEVANFGIGPPDVESHQVVHPEPCSADWSLSFYPGMGKMPIVMVQPKGQAAFCLPRPPDEMESRLRIFVPAAVRALMEKLAPRLEVAARRMLVQVVDLNPRIPERIAAGEPFEIGMTNPQYVTALIASGHVDGASHRPFGRVPLAICRKAGTEEAVLTGAEEIVAMLRSAKSIGYTSSGTSGRIYVQAIDRLGLSRSITPKSRPMGSGEPVASVAAGEAELAIAPLTTIISNPGVVPAAIFPDELGTNIDISIFLSASPKDGADSVLELLSGTELDDELTAAGLLRFELK